MKTHSSGSLFTPKTTKKELQQIILQLQEEISQLTTELPLSVEEEEEQETYSNTEESLTGSMEQHFANEDWASSRAAFRVELFYRGENTLNGRILQLRTKEVQQFEGLDMAAIEAFIMKRLPAATREKYKLELVKANMEEEPTFSKDEDTSTGTEDKASSRSVEPSKEVEEDTLNKAVGGQTRKPSVTHREIPELEQFELKVGQTEVSTQMIAEGQEFEVVLSFGTPSGKPYEGLCELHIIAESFTGPRSQQIIQVKLVKIIEGKATLMIKDHSLVPSTYKIIALVQLMQQTERVPLLQAHQIVRVNSLVSV